MELNGRKSIVVGIIVGLIVGTITFLFYGLANGMIVGLSVTLFSAYGMFSGSDANSGGRYSVFYAMGAFLLGLFGIWISANHDHHWIISKIIVTLMSLGGGLAAVAISVLGMIIGFSSRNQKVIP